jgi:hypothetical protein
VEKLKKGNDMLVVIERKKFESLNDIALIWTCVEPAIQPIRGKNFAVKSDVYLHLTPGQRALLMFQVLHGHTSNGVGEFYSHLSYLLSNEAVWSQLKEGMSYFGDLKMAQLLEEMKIVYQKLKTEEFQENAEQHTVILDAQDQNMELISAMERLNKALGELLPATTGLVGAYVRNHAQEFVQFID